jgi:hypothetical protein
MFFESSDRINDDLRMIDIYYYLYGNYYLDQYTAIKRSESCVN